MFHYNDKVLRDMVADINAMKNVSFVLVPGDLYQRFRALQSCRGAEDPRQLEDALLHNSQQPRCSQERPVGQCLGSRAAHLPSGRWRIAEKISDKSANCENY
jgi:hypothetical protein